MTKKSLGKRNELLQRRRGALTTRTDLEPQAIKDIAGTMNAILAEVFALYLKTKNFHWHIIGPHFRDYLLMLDEQAEQLFAITDVIAERVRKLGASTLKSIAHISRLQSVLDNDAHNVCDDHRDVATTSLIEVWIDETERRTWFLSESKRGKQ